MESVLVHSALSLHALNDFFKGCNMSVKSVPALSRGAYESLRFTSDEGLVDLDIACLFELTQVRTEVAVGQLQQFPQVSEVDLLVLIEADERRHDLQPNRLMDGIIKLSHFLPPSQPYIKACTQKRSAPYHCHPETIVGREKVITH
jgi:hypothetical protein